VTAAIEQLTLQSRNWGIELEPSQLSSLERYADLLAGYQLANVIGTKDRDQILVEHITDALSCLTSADLLQGCSLVDVGAGGGLPGIPLSIARPGLHVTLLEAAEKKVRFLRYARDELDLPNLEVLHTRAEDAGRGSSYREAFDIAAARALASLPVVVEYCAPLLRIGGAILAMKGRIPEEELSKGVTASRHLGIKLQEVREVKYLMHLPQMERRLVVFKKIHVSPDSFPRRTGMAKKRPLGVQTKRLRQ
jgi:16S rRNA (guanine527-N7)-methyltransferase